MLVVMAVDAKEFPVAAVRRVVVMVVVLVMDREFLELFALELTSAAPADMRKKFERALAVGLLTFLLEFSCPGNYCSDGVFIVSHENYLVVQPPSMRRSEPVM